MYFWDVGDTFLELFGETKWVPAVFISTECFE